MTTIVALSTPIGRGAIAVVRLSGDLSLSIVKSLAPDLENVKARRASLATLRYTQTGETLDQVLVTYFPSPHSVTGEDVVEISCHGSSAVVRQLLDQALHLGARMAGPGEFTLRALTNGKINLSQAEAIRDLIAAQTTAAAKQASRQVGGELSTALERFKKRLVRVIVVLESALEFVEDDLPATELRDLQNVLGTVRQGVLELAESYSAGRFLQDGIKVAIVGSPNVGKSSLFNRLSEQDRAIVTDIPGTTRDTLTHAIDVGGIPVLLIDTAGLRETNDSIESLGIARTLTAISDADLVLRVLDGTRSRETETDLDGASRSILVLNKCDLQQSGDYSEESDAIRVSAMTGAGLDGLRAAILESVNHHHSQHEGLLITNARHHYLLRGATQEIDSAMTLLNDRVTEELILVPLHNALKYLDQITGETTTEDILSEVFRNILHWEVVMSFDESFDVIVIGAGHAGSEAASAAARLGVATGLITLNLDLIGQMSCNPAVGGIAKGHLVREIDALGGIMGRVIDRTGIQFRLLNRSRGPAVQSPRAQADRSLYRTEMRRVLEGTPNLSLRQGKVVDLILHQREVVGVELEDGRQFRAKAVIVATGTFLNGLIHTGRRTYSGGRTGEPASIELAESLRRIGFPVGRLKTGTPPRLDGRTIDWTAFEPQPGDKIPVPFSFATDQIEQPQINCYIGYTTNQIHDAIRENLAESPLYSGKIQGVGPRYCPSIEDKVVKFADKSRHQLFLEPEGHDTNEVYLNGFSTSLPAELQQDLVRMIPGLDEAKVIRPGYAIEYDFVDPRELGPDLQTRRVSGLFHAGQINGTTGYEEAACQGLIAGINAALFIQNRAPFRLRRNEAYTGVLIEDLVNQGVDEPYRIFTSRAEYRLALRYDNADARLEAYGRELGLMGDSDWERFNAKQNRLAELRKALDSTRFRRSDATYAALSSQLDADLGDAISLTQLAKRPGVSTDLIRVFLPGPFKNVSESDLQSVLADSLYDGYLQSQKSTIDRLYQHDALRIPNRQSYRGLSGLSNEVVERLERAKPRTFGEARRISGLTPAALSTLLVHLSVPQHKQA